MGLFIELHRLIPPPPQHLFNPVDLDLNSRGKVDYPWPCDLYILSDIRLDCDPIVFYAMLLNVSENSEQSGHALVRV